MIPSNRATIKQQFEENAGRFSLPLRAIIPICHSSLGFATLSCRILATSRSCRFPAQGYCLPFVSFRIRPAGPYTSSLVGVERFELSRPLQAPEPKSGAATNYATLPMFYSLLQQSQQVKWLGLYLGKIFDDLPEKV